MKVFVSICEHIWTIIMEISTFTSIGKVFSFLLNHMFDSNIPEKNQRGYKNCLQKLQADSNENFQGRVKFKIPSQVEAYVNKKSDRTIDGSTYKTYLASRPQSMTEANGTRDCTSVRHVVESKFKEMKGFKLIRTTWPHCKIQDQVS